MVLLMPGSLESLAVQQVACPASCGIELCMNSSDVYMTRWHMCTCTHLSSAIQSACVCCWVVLVCMMFVCWLQCGHGRPSYHGPRSLIMTSGLNKRADPCVGYNDASTGLAPACLSKIWASVGCVNAAYIPITYLPSGWWKTQTKATLVADMRIYAASTSEAWRSEACYGTDRSKWPGVPSSPQCHLG